MSGGKNETGPAYYLHEQGSGTISRSYAAGAVTGTGAASTQIGGLVGRGYGAITDAYATGAVTGFDTVGGLVGLYTASGSATRSYAAGLVTGTTNTGGLIGTLTANSNISQSYWDTQTTTRSAGFGSNSGSFSATGLTTDQMQDMASFGTTYTGWGFTTIWSPPNQVGQNNGSPTAFYPQLYLLGPVLPMAVMTASMRSPSRGPPIE
jgi:hypothetical protein